MGNSSFVPKNILTDAGLKRHWQNRKKVKIIVSIVILLAIIGGFFYWYETQVGSYQRNLNKKNTSNLKIPQLFSRGDYRVEDRVDGKYIVVDKVGLTAKVPAGWRVEFEGNDMSDGTSQYWVNLLSQDAEKKGSLVIKGCGITMTLGYEEKNNKDLNEQILAMQDNSQDNNLFRTGYQYKIFNIGKNKGVKWIGKENDTFGKNVGLDIPVGVAQTIGLSSIFPVNNAGICENHWEDFLKTIDLR
ncbi:MAG: hypothetical protein NTV62_01325 [Candidatus Gribaldobacteria bacterium]|nr:hypothetical protein [Candidatus Gribaldobacteria bacterium]